MGIYYARGVERLMKVNGSMLTVVSMRETDERLMKSNWYLKQQDTFFGNALFRADKIIPIQDQDIDVEMTEAEKAKEKTMIDLHGTAAPVASWYDVVYMSDTY